MIIARVIVVVIIAETAADDVDSHRIGKLSGHRPVVFFHGLFGLLVFAAQEPVACLRGSADEHLGFASSHDGEDLRTVIGLLVEMLTVGIDEILGPHDIGSLEGWDDVAVLETTVEDGDGDAFSHESDVMQSLPSEHLNLFFAIAIGGCLHTVPRVETVVGTGFDEAVDAVGGYPYQFRFSDTLEGVETTEERGVVRTNEYRIVPSAGSDDGPLHRTTTTLPADILGGTLESTDILLTDR